MEPVLAVYDACVLDSAPLRDLLLHLAGVGLVRPRWTDAIHEEWTRNLLANRSDLSRAQLERPGPSWNGQSPRPKSGATSRGSPH